MESALALNLNPREGEELLLTIIRGFLDRYPIPGVSPRRDRVLFGRGI
ncbi:conserved protein of unknown function [Limnospira indica PCC 8005]|uniref:Uncharacterized protein n=1 Tax=Limnospira indica PCC 8005 TaxID=376219 RepID=A0A9P1P2W6_9CYAN|nr:conserved protein of unknown function [Limnospira indica PCC 8005]